MSKRHIFSIARYGGGMASAKPKTFVKREMPLLERYEEPIAEPVARPNDEERDHVSVLDRPL